MLARAKPISCHGKTATLAGAGLIAAALGMQADLLFGATAEAVKISQAWVPPAEPAGGDVPLLMTIKNEADVADTLVRVGCPVANFTEKHIVDRGEGAPAMRAIPAIPIAANSTIVLKPDGYHVMLLQTRQALAEGETFTCTVVFQKAGTIETEVRVSRSPS
nr:copper chaperone PCu(A)C [Bradyrhizobium sp.]